MAERIFVAVTSVVLVGYLYLAIELPRPDFGGPYGPAVFPILVGAAGLCALTGLVVETVMKTSNGEAAAQEARSRPWAIAAVTGWSVLYVLLIEPLGYIVVTIPYLLGLTAYFNRGKWLANVAFSIVFALGIYFLFTRGLQLSLPAGVLGALG